MNATSGEDVGDRLDGHFFAFEEAVGFGGAFVDLKHICLNLRRLGMRVTVARSYEDPCWDPLVATGCTILTHTRWNLAEHLWRRHNTDRRIRMVAYGAEQLALNVPIGVRYGLWARKHGVTVVFCNNAFTRNTGGVLASQIARCPLYSYNQGVPDGSGGYRQMLRVVDRHFTVSNYVREHELRFGTDPSRTETLYPGVDPAPDPTLTEPRRQDGRVRVGMVAVFTAWKGHLAFLQAFAQVAAQAPEADAWLFGKALPTEPETPARIRAEIVRLGLEDRVRLVEGRTRPETIYPEVDFTVHCSTLPEPFGRVVVEPMAYRRPVIAANSGGPLEVIRDGQNGYLVDPGKPAELADRILRFVRDRPHRLACGERAFQDVARRFSYPAVLEPLIHHLRADAERRRRAASPPR